jgi:hypothetical protein
MFPPVIKRTTFLFLNNSLFFKITAKGIAQDGSQIIFNLYIILDKLI